MIDAPARVTRVVCAQIDPMVGDLPGNRVKCLDAIRAAKADGGDVIVLPELATSGYVFESAAEARGLSMTRDDVFFDEVSAILRPSDAVVVVGFCERDSADELWNSAAVVTAVGVQAVYRKAHLWDREKVVFTAGSDLPPVIETPHGRLGVLICYDLEFAEMPRSLALRGADLLVVPTNWPRGEHPDDEHPAEIIHAQSAARANGVFIACCDRSGAERGQLWHEGTVIIDQFGWVRAETTGRGRHGHRIATGHETAEADVFPRLARDKAVSPHNDLLGDRRPDIYALGPS